MLRVAGGWGVSGPMTERGADELARSGGSEWPLCTERIGMSSHARGRGHCVTGALV